MKKEFFRNRTPGEIRELDFAGEVNNGLISHILNIDNDEYLVIGRPIISENVRTSKKHGPEVIIPRAKSQAQLMQDRVTPVKLREQVFDELYRKHQATGKSPAYSGLVFRPARGSVDSVPRKITLVGALEGLRIFGYSHQIPGTQITFDKYADAKAVETDGARFVGSVPSREEGSLRHEIGLEGVALRDNDFKYVIAQNISSDHSCRDKRYNREMRFQVKDEQERSKILYLCPHDIALYLKIIDSEWNENKNMVPLIASQIPLATQDTVDFYKKLGNNVLIQDVYRTGKNAGKLYTRALNQAEQEALLWGIVMKLGHDSTFFATKDLKEYDWNIE